ncbi:hypothetical protein [Tenacibaculum sp.]|uniref:hypothetical protein n=1 Tax=Tenacibaculum sp. TaxID=1906242 RepID=UPI003D14092B
MKKSILNLGKALNRAEQQQINGGKFICCYDNPLCPPTHATSCIIIAGRCIYEPEEGVPC